MDLTLTHALLLRQLMPLGWPCELLDNLCRRSCSNCDEAAARGCWDELVTAGYTTVRDGKFWLSKDGVKALKECKQRHLV